MSIRTSRPWLPRVVLIALTGLLGVLSLAAASTAVAAPPSTTANTTAATARTHNLLLNPGFEQLRRQTSQPQAWTAEAWVTGARLTSDTARVHSGHRSVRISATTPNDARWIQTVTVQRDTRYRLTGWIRTQSVAHSGESVDAGANLSVLGRWDRTAAVLGTTRGWTLVGLTVDTGDATSLVIAARLGFWSGTTTGTAWYDDLQLTRVGPTPPVAHWKLLTLIYPTVDFSWTDADGATQHVTSQITAAEQKAAADAARAFGRIDLPALTSGNLVATTTVRTVSRTLTDLDPYFDGWWPGPGTTAAERDPAFDAVIVIWQPMGVDVATGEPRFFGGAAGLTPDMGTGQTYATVMLDSVVHSGTRNIFRHEFGHSLLSYFAATGASPQPSVNNHSDGSDYVHCGTGVPYVWVDETLAAPVPNSIYNNQSGFTHDYYSGTTALTDDPDTCLGITRDAWASGGPLTHR